MAAESTSHIPKKKSSREWIILFVSGMCMGAADLVPGISGGTVAFILGFYQDLIESIKSLNAHSLKLLFRGRFKDFFSLISWQFLTVLGGGVLSSIFAFAHAIHFFLGHEIYRVYLYSLFFGLILASIYFCVKQINEWKLKNAFSLCTGMIIALSLSGSLLQNNDKEDLYSVLLSKPYKEDAGRPVVNYEASANKLTEVSLSSLSAMLAKEVISPDTVVEDAFGRNRLAGEVAEPWYGFGFDLWIIFCGSIAVCALLLPGISGSYLLTVLGMYGVVLGALIDFMKGIRQLGFDTGAFSILFNLIIGIIIGALVFSRAISWLLNHYREMTLASLIGFIVGALPTVWPFWSYHYVLDPLHLEKGAQLIVTAPILPYFFSSMFFQSAALGILGFFMVISIEMVAGNYKLSYNDR